MADAAHGVEGSTIVSTMARNGTDFGIRVSGLGDRWFTAPVATPEGLYFPGFHGRGRQRRHRRQHHHRDGGHRRLCHGQRAGHRHLRERHAQGRHQRHAGDVRDQRRRAQVLSPCRRWTFAARRPGIDIRKVVETGITPRVNTGIAHKDAGVGQVGAGLVRPPMAMFEEAVSGVCGAVRILEVEGWKKDRRARLGRAHGR